MEKTIHIGVMSALVLGMRAASPISVLTSAARISSGSIMPKKFSMN
jgi:hypothetical protein